MNKENRSDQAEQTMSAKPLFGKFDSTREAFGAFIYKRTGFLFAFFVTVIFYWPSLLDGSADAGIIYMGDTLGFYLPALSKTHQLVHFLNFTAIDFSLFNGSSDFFLSPNYFAVHPLVIIFCLVFSPESTTLLDYGRFVMLLIAFHSFLACYFSIKLFRRFFSFNFGTAALIAVLFAFNINVVRATGQIAFIFSISIIPWVAYGALSYQKKPDLRHLLFGSLPVVLGLLGGYMPLGATSLALSVIIVAMKLFFNEDSLNTSKEKVQAFLRCILPCIVAIVLVAPYLFSVLQFNSETISSGRPSLFFSAHQMAEVPQTLLRFISTHFQVPGPFYEFSIVCGFPAIIVFALFLFSPGTINRISKNEWILLKVSFVIYFLAVLAIFGEYSVVSDLVYYLVPSVGGMHIYQRFLLPAHFFFAVVVALMLRAVTLSRPVTAIRIIIAVFFIATVVSAYLVAFSPESAREIGINNYLVFELFLGFLFSCVLLVPGKIFVYGAVMVLFCLPSMDLMNDRSHGQNTFQKQRELKKLAIDENERAGLVSWMKRHSDKAVIKYVDITPKYKSRILGIETFPKDFPRIVLDDINLSSYGGHNYYLGARGDYVLKMPVAGENIILNPDWDLVFNTGVDFLIAPWSHGMLQSLIPQNRPQDVYKLPNDIAVIPMPKHPFDGVYPLFDNGVFRVFPKVAVSQSSKNKRVNIAAGKPAFQSSTMGAYDARLAVDGDINGDFASGSVTHTEQEINAWFEIDLGKVEQIGEISIWNRTDSAGGRLSNYWVFISEEPFQPTETASILKDRPRTWNSYIQKPVPKRTIATSGVLGRYIRIQFGGDQPASNSYLSLAEVEVFSSGDTHEEIQDSKSVENMKVQINRFITNFANHVVFDLNVDQPAVVQYLFWKNPRLHFSLNNKPIDVKRADELTFIDIPEGRSTIEIKYIHRPLKLFWFLYFIYGLIFLWIALPAFFQSRIQNWIRSWR